MSRRLRLSGAFAAFLSIIPPAFADGYRTGDIPAPTITLPDDGREISALVFLFSDRQGWGAREDAQARAFAQAGAGVVGIDFPSYAKSLSALKDDCVYMVSDIEDLSRQVQKKIGSAAYRYPVIAGIGEGAALVLGMIAQSPDSTIDEVIAVDPLGGIPLSKDLCTTASRQVANNRTIYGLRDGALPAKISIVITRTADDAGKTHAARLKREHPDVNIVEGKNGPGAALVDTLIAKITNTVDTKHPVGLPVLALDAKPAMDTMAIVYSGEAGWRGVDSEIGGYLQAQGIPVAGIDTLRYLWKKREAQEIADDMAGLIEHYGHLWSVRHILLIGYSAGADVLPRAYNLLPLAVKDRIRQITLLGFSGEAISGAEAPEPSMNPDHEQGGDVLGQTRMIDPEIIQCIHEEKEPKGPCAWLGARGYEIIAIDGVDDEDYQVLGKHIRDGLIRRLKKVE